MRDREDTIGPDDLSHNVELATGDKPREEPAIVQHIRRSFATCGPGCPDTIRFSPQERSQLLSHLDRLASAGAGEPSEHDRSALYCPYGCQTEIKEGGERDWGRYHCPLCMRCVDLKTQARFAFGSGLAPWKAAAEIRQEALLACQQERDSLRSDLAAAKRELEAERSHFEDVRGQLEAARDASVKATGSPTIDATIRVLVEQRDALRKELESARSQPSVSAGERPSDEELKRIGNEAGLAAQKAAYRESPGGIDWEIVRRAGRWALFDAGVARGEAKAKLAREFWDEWSHEVMDLLDSRLKGDWSAAEMRRRHRMRDEIEEAFAALWDEPAPPKQEPARTDGAQVMAEPNIPTPAGTATSEAGRSISPPAVERWRSFNETTGAFGYMTALGTSGANSHPDRCVCQSDDPTPHKHYTNDPLHPCARCSECKAYQAAVPLADPPAAADRDLASAAEGGGEELAIEAVAAELWRLCARESAAFRSGQHAAIPAIRVALMMARDRRGGGR